MCTRILVADDHGAILSELLRILQPEYQVVASASNGRSLVCTAAAVSPDVIVVDVSMPGMSGLQAASTLRQEGSRAKIIFLSMFTDTGIVSAAFAAGATGYVFKDQVVPDLKTAIKNALEGKSFVSVRAKVAAAPGKGKVA